MGKPDGGEQRCASRGKFSGRRWLPLAFGPNNKRMKYDFPLLNNPQTLIPLMNQFNGQTFIPKATCLDAIFIPFKGNKKYISSLLFDLKWFTGNIFLMPSSCYDFDKSALKQYPNAKILFVDDSRFVSLFNNLKTSGHKLSVADCWCWDLPIKRNYAIYFSLKERFRKILLIDDDMIGINQTIIETGTHLLEQFVAVGSFVENFPDTSIIGHVEIEQHVNVKCFLSGSFLFVSPQQIKSFFPKIYNEDWLFMIPMILDSKICTAGDIHQKSYDPFHKPEKAVFQEFGEVIAEGLFALLSKSAFNLRHSKEIWNDVINNRKTLLIELLGNTKNKLQMNIIGKAISKNAELNPSDCIDYIYSLDHDTDSWCTFLKEIS
ncbi:MAG: hypothetical protein HY885_05290 [Deltaproteobacteria bacterium]|nr:hypothetical protein [Deltaproteobacteria bacterium]